jgi:hypothetical protein
LLQSGQLDEAQPEGHTADPQEVAPAHAVAGPNASTSLQVQHVILLFSGRRRTQNSNIALMAEYSRPTILQLLLFGIRFFHRPSFV